MVDKTTPNTLLPDLVPVRLFQEVSGENHFVLIEVSRDRPDDPRSVPIIYIGFGNHLTYYSYDVGGLKVTRPDNCGSQERMPLAGSLYIPASRMTGSSSGVHLSTGTTIPAYPYPNWPTRPA